MFKYVLGRIGAMLLTLFLVMTLSFWVIRLMPMSIFENPEVSPEIQAKLEAEMHLHEPMLAQYYYFIEGIVTRGDFGTSVKVRPGLDVFEILSIRIPPTVVLNIFSLLISIPLGIIVGTWAALKRNKLTDNILSFLIVICISVPSFVFASLLQYCFTYLWPIFPTLYDSQATTFGGQLYSMILPIIALALGPIASIARYLRGELIETLSSEYLLLARTKGLTRTEATVKHAFRNSLVPIANTIIPMITGIMGGSLVVEKMFAVPGMGGLLIDSILAGDHFLTVALLIFYSAISLFTILIVDISYGIIDPRIRVGGGK
ncbi:MAG: ABC transporter permease [Clostridia bacterium]|nr:ABC transporter permease [Clostridia bacterium]